MGKKRLRVEAFLAAAASPVPPPIDELMPDPALRDEIPEDLAWLLRLLPRADVYLQDEVEIALHATLTRACNQGILVLSFDQVVTDTCAWKIESKTT